MIFHRQRTNQVHICSRITECAAQTSNSSSGDLEHAGTEKGIEADACYSVRGSQRAASKRSLDLPPDIAVEIDITSESFKKFPFYAALSVPEVWWCDGRTFRFYELAGGVYVEAERSRFLSKLTGFMLAEAIEIMKTWDQTAAREAFFRRVQSLR